MRAQLAEEFTKKLEEAGGDVQKRLAQHIAEVSEKAAGKPKAKAKANTKNAKGQARKQKKLKLGLIRKTKAWKQRKNLKKSQHRLIDKAGGALFLGEEGGDFTGKQVRLVDFGLPSLLRNSPARVETHYTTGLATVMTASGTVRSFEQHKLYVLTGKEKLPLPEDTPDMRQCSLAQKQRGLAASGAQLETKLKANSLLETPELGAAWEELGFRAASKGDVWPNSQAIFLNPVVSAMWLAHWKHSPGSPESQYDLHCCRDQVECLLSQPRQAGFVALPIVAGGHYTLLLVARQASPDCQDVHNKFVVAYKDSLWGQEGQGHMACRQQAQVGLNFISAVFGPDSLSQTVVPAVASSAKQKDSHSCGFFVTAWVEEEYRLLRGEGVYRLPDTFTAKAESLNRWNKAIMAVKANAEAKAKAKAKAQAAASHQPLPLVALSTGCSAQPPPAASSKQIVLAPSVPVSQSDIWGCARCRWAKAGCASCNPAKMEAKAAKEASQR